MATRKKILIFLALSLLGNVLLPEALEVVFTIERVPSGLIYILLKNMAIAAFVALLAFFLIRELHTMHVISYIILSAVVIPSALSVLILYIFTNAISNTSFEIVLQTISHLLICGLASISFWFILRVLLAKHRDK